VSPVRYELGFYIPQDGILHNHRREGLIYYKNIISFERERKFVYTVTIIAKRIQFDLSSCCCVLKTLLELGQF
jgi:hypothetical protein